MISLERCKQILNVGTTKYSLDEIKIIRQYLYTIANIEYQLANKL
jgi:hypothetical protein